MWRGIGQEYSGPLANYDGDVELSGLDCVIGGDIDGNVKSEDGNVTIAAEGSVDGNVEVKNGTIRIRGSLNGNAKQEERGSLLIWGSVDGTAEEFGSGRVRVRAGADVNGNVGEYDRGNCVVSSFAYVNGNQEGGCAHRATSTWEPGTRPGLLLHVVSRTARASVAGAAPTAEGHR